MYLCADEMMLHLQNAVHKEDILTVAFGVPHLMATASFDGKVRNMLATLFVKHNDIPHLQ